MSAPIEYVSKLPFVDGLYGKMSSNGYFSCYFKTCPFSLKMVMQQVNDQKVAVDIERVLFGFHNHQITRMSKTDMKREMQRKAESLAAFSTGEEALQFHRDCEKWKQVALSFSKKKRERLLDVEAVKIYALNHMEKSAKQVHDACCVKINIHSICNMRRAALKEIGDARNVDDLIENGGHHLLGHDKKDILVFGMTAALHYLSVTPVIQCDGTFTCVVLPFTQLYVFHAVLGNGVSYPMLFCLARGKDKELYVRLLNLVETIAMEKINKPIFKRPVDVVMDFEQAMITALSRHNAAATVHCCFFHFTANIRKNSRSVMAEIKGAVGQDAEKRSAAEKLKRAIMMLPLLPEELITVRLDDALIARFDAAVPECAGAFGPLRNKLVANYIKPNALFPKRLWSVSGRKIRTNNAAESFNSRLNGSLRVSGAVTLDMFLFAVEKQMRNTIREIDGGCQPHSKSIFTKRDELLKAELAMLFRGTQGVYRFLDHCSSIMRVMNEADIRNFVSRRATEGIDEADNAWIGQHRAVVVDSMVQLNQRLKGARVVNVGDVMDTIEMWAFDKQTVNMTEQDVEMSVLSMAPNEPNQSFLEIRQMLEEGRW